MHDCKVGPHLLDLQLSNLGIIGVHSVIHSAYVARCRHREGYCGGA